MCSSDFDCPGNLECLPSRLPWAPIEIVNKTFCGCSVARFGFMEATDGTEVCSILGPHTVYSLTVNFVSTLICVICLIYGMITLAALKRDKKLASNDIQRTHSLVLLAYILAVASGIVRAIEVMNPLEHVDFLNGQKVHPLYEAQYLLVNANQFVILIAVSNIPLVWAYVVVCTKKLNVSRRYTFRLRLCVRGFQVSVFMARLVAYFLEKTSVYQITALIATFSLVGVICIYGFVRRWFVALFQRAGCTDEQSISVLRRMNKLTNFVIFTFTSSLVALSIYAAYAVEGTEYVCPKGRVCTIFFFRDYVSVAGKGFEPDSRIVFTITILLVLANLIACQYYCCLSLGFDHICDTAPARRRLNLNGPARPSTNSTEEDVLTRNQPATSRTIERV